MTQGTVKWFNSRKGYGFIAVDGDNTEVFVHANDISGSSFRKELFENQVVQFEIGQGQKGPAAKNVSVVE